MHDYSIDGHPKEKILFGLAFISIVVAPWINSLALHLLSFFQIQLGVTKAPLLAIPTFSLFLVIYFVFNKFLWKVRLFRKYLLVPDLNGKWSCTGKTVLKNGQPLDFEWTGTMTITQSWSKILIHLQVPQSSASVSKAASIYCVEGVGYTLLYQYENEPSADQHQLSRHTGAAELSISLDDQKGSGHYFTDQHRSTVGTLTISRLSK